MGFFARHKKKLIALGVVLASGPLAHVGVLVTTRIAPPKVTLPAGEVKPGEGGVTRVGASYTRVREGLREVYLEGTPEQMGAAHARLLRDRMIANEGELWGDFTRFVPLSLARALIMDIGRVRYRHVDRGMPQERLSELGTQALAFAPDPYDDRMGTFHRMVFLHALYDIALSFEESPLIGCSALGFGPAATADGHTLVARAFDFEAGEIYDRDKAVFFVRGEGKIPFASVAWPGLVGVLTGMNEEGVMVLVNGGRAGQPAAEGIPVVFSLREVLERAKTTAEATAILSEQRVMVSHIVMVADAAGRFAVVERAPGAPAFVRDTFTDPARVGVTNHFEGALRDDPKNARVKAQTTTLARRSRVDELLASAKGVTPASAITMLRDHECSAGEACALGDRRTIDALIATHGVVADTTARVLWVSAGPHLSGKFVRLDLREIFATGHDPAKDSEPVVHPEDGILFDERYDEGRARAGSPRVGGDAPK